jgi:hypothetical protein
VDGDRSPGEKQDPVEEVEDEEEDGEEGQKEQVQPSCSDFLLQSVVASIKFSSSGFFQIKVSFSPFSLEYMDKRSVKREVCNLKIFSFFCWDSS